MALRLWQRNDGDNAHIRACVRKNICTNICGYMQICDNAQRFASMCIGKFWRMAIPYSHWLELYVVWGWVWRKSCQNHFIVMHFHLSISPGFLPKSTSSVHVCDWNIICIRFLLAFTFAYKGGHREKKVTKLRTFSVSLWVLAFGEPIIFIENSSTLC